jgi:dihydrofolate reductase
MATLPYLVYYAAASLDGFIATSDGGVEWLAPFEASAEDYGYADFYASVDALVMGRRTYDQVLTFGEWPYQDKPVCVFSTRPLVPVSASVVASPAAPAAVLGDLEAAGAARVWLVGGGALAGSLAAASLIDEYIISTMPVLLGSGVPLLGGVEVSSTLTLVESRRYVDGVIQSVYRPAR